MRKPDEIALYKALRALAGHPGPDATAADARTQFQTACGELGLARKIEPLPDAPEYVLTPEGYVQPKWAAEDAKRAREALAATEQRRWTTIPVVGLEGEARARDNAARADTPEDRIEALEEELRVRTAQRDSARQSAQSHYEDVRALVDAIEGRPVATTAPAACWTALDARAWSKQREEAADQWRDTLNEIAAIVWPHKTPKAAKEYALTELVEAVRKMVAEREKARGLLAEARRHSSAWLDDLALRRAREERNEARADADGLRRQIQAMDEEALERAREVEEMRQERDEAVRKCGVARDERAQAVCERDALCAQVERQVISHLLAILEGREP